MNVGSNIRRLAVVAALVALAAGAGSVAVHADQRPVVRKVAALDVTVRGEALREEDGCAFEVGQRARRRFVRRQLLQLVEIVLQVGGEILETGHRMSMRQQFPAGIKRPLRRNTPDGGLQAERSEGTMGSGTR